MALSNLQIRQMGPFLPPLTPFSLLFLSLSLFAIIGSSSDITDLVYKGCADQKFQDPTGSYAQALNNLFDTLASQSSSAKFFNTTSGDGQSAIAGLFQCRGDLSASDCNTCVRRTPAIARRLCGGSTIAARVQLVGCYMRYEQVGFRQVAATELLYKICGSTKASGPGFEARLESALEEIEKGVGGGNGFYTGGFESVYVLGQCEGDLSSGECVECVKSGVDRVKSECGSSISGQIYLQQCYVSYSYYPSGVPNQSLSSGSGTRRQSAQKTVAIILGGLAGLGFVLAFLLLVKSRFKRRDRGKYYSG